MVGHACRLQMYIYIPTYSAHVSEFTLRASGGAPDGADPGPAPGLVWLEDGLEVPFRDAGAPRPWPEASSDAPDAPVEHLRPRDHREEDEPPTLLWV